MNLERQEEIFKAELSDTEFNKLSKFIYQEYGIKMPEAKKIMLQSRLQKRLRTLNIPNYKEYVDFVFSKQGMQQELIHMIDVVTTNKTDFFREPAHFDFMLDTILPGFKSQGRPTNDVKVWSAGCSSGEEPYTLGITLSEFAATNPGFNFSIFASDISSRILQTAVNAIYPEDRIDVIPLTLKKKYFLKGKDKVKKQVRVGSSLRSKVSFKRINFMDNTYDAPKGFDLIFCRNVLIYFDRETQEKVITKLCQHLKPGGWFFLGHSESTLNLNVPLKQIKPTVYQRI